MSENPYSQLVSLELDHPVWERFFLPAPLSVIGTREESGDYDLAPKHMVVPLSWQNYFGFVCSPSHSTYQNIRREEAFTVSFPRPEQVVLTSLTASPRCDDGTKIEVRSVPTIPARRVDGILIRDASPMFECELERIVDGFGPNSLVAGKIIAAHVHEDALRAEDRDDQEVLAASPLMVYLHPGRFTQVVKSHGFPFPAGFRR